jgi:very-short-patch-repair endonuclease
LARRVRRAIAGRFEGRSESGIESIVRFLLGEKGIRAEIQVRIDGVGRVDLLIDGWLIIEIEGGSHADLATMRRDRYRDAMAVQQGYRTLRFSYGDVMHRWPHLLRTVRIVLAEGPGRMALPVR